MAAKMLHYRTSTAGTRPTAGNVTVGQVTLNTGDGSIYTKKSDNSLVEARQLKTYPSSFTAAFTLNSTHIYGYLRCATNSFAITVPAGLMQPGEYLLIRYLPGLLASLTITPGSGVTINGTLSLAAAGTLRLQCFAVDNYDCY